MVSPVERASVPRVLAVDECGAAVDTAAVAAPRVAVGKYPRLLVPRRAEVHPLAVMQGAVRPCAAGLVGRGRPLEQGVGHDPLTPPSPRARQPSCRAHCRSSERQKEAWPGLTSPPAVSGALEELRFHATVICSIRVSMWGPFGASWEARGDVATSSLSAERLRVV